MIHRHQLLAAAATLALGLSATGPSHADDVYLVNGEVFEGVVAELTETQIRIQMSNGELRLPRSLVERIDQQVSPLEVYQERKDALVASTADAAGWLELAQWSQQQGLHLATREAALRAAQLDPGLTELPPLMQAIGYRQEPTTGRWMPFADYMRSKGLIAFDGEWITPEQLAQRRRAAQERLADQIARRKAQELQARQVAAEAREIREAERRRAAQAAAPPVVIYNVPTQFVTFHAGPYFSQPVQRIPLAPSAESQNPYNQLNQRHPAPRMNLIDRQPGSLIPGFLRTGPP